MLERINDLEVDIRQMWKPVWYGLMNLKTLIMNGLWNSSTQAIMKPRYTINIKKD